MSDGMLFRAGEKYPRELPMDQSFISLDMGQDGGLALTVSFPDLTEKGFHAWKSGIRRVSINVFGEGEGEIPVPVWAFAFRCRGLPPVEAAFNARSVPASFVQEHLNSCDGNRNAIHMILVGKGQVVKSLRTISFPPALMLMFRKAIDLQTQRPYVPEEFHQAYRRNVIPAYPTERLLNMGTQYDVPVEVKGNTR